MKILLINHYAGSPKHGMEYRPYYLAREWLKLGHRVRVIASSSSHLHQHAPFIDGPSTLEKIEGIEYLWLLTPVYHGNGAKRIVNIFSFLRRLFTEREEILRDFKPDIIIASSPHPFVFRGAKSISKKTGAKLIYEVRDLWPLSLVELLGVSSFHPLVMLMQHEEKIAYKEADKVASLLPRALDYMGMRGLSPEKFIYTPNGIAVDDWADSESLPYEYLQKIRQFRSRFGFLVGYAGTHGPPNALRFLVNAADLIKEHSVGIVLIGNGLEKNALIMQAKTLGLRNILFLDSISKSKIPSFFSQMDALYIGWEKKTLYRFGISANKIFEYMMSGKPIIHSVEAGNDPIADSGCGITCAAEDSSLIARSFIHMSSLLEKDRAELGMKGKRHVVEHYDYSILAKNYLDIL